MARALPLTTANPLPGRSGTRRQGRSEAPRELLLAPDDLAPRRSPGTPAQRELADDLQAAARLVVSRRVPHPRRRRRGVGNLTRQGPLQDEAEGDRAVGV